jgi:PAS domain S-box-containing protein
VEDVLLDAAFEKHRAIAVSAGFRAIQSTPLMRRDGELLGLISTHFREPHRPSPLELQRIDLYARLAESAIETRLAERALLEGREEVLHHTRRIEETQSTLHTILEQAPIGITLTGGPPDFPIIANSDHVCRLFERTPESLVGMPAGQHAEAFGILMPDGVTRPAPHQMGLYRAAHEGKIVTNEDWMVERPDGRRLDMLTNVSPIRGPLGEIIGAMKCWIDITERKKAEEMLRASEQHFRSYFQQGLIGMSIMSPQGRYLEVNDELCRISGYERDELLQRTWFDLTHPDDLAGDSEKWNHVLAGAMNHYSLDKRWNQKDGRVVHTTWAVRCVRRSDGAPDYLIGLVLDTTERTQAEEALKKAYEEINQLKDRLAQEKIYLEEEIRSERGFETIVGDSPKVARVLRLIETVAPTSTTVLVEGETGTGKELIARAIHDRSRRHDRTFVKVNCAAIPAGLLESELFGHEKGAFTGAIAQRIGRFELAHQGTIFLDEIGELPLDLQSKLLRVLQEREFERVGASRSLRVDVRLIAATNRDLRRLVAEHRFRSDLFYRLNVFPIVSPPLRERAEDIPALVRHFVRRYASAMNKTILTIPSETMPVLCAQTWPGNVRELENFIERSVILSRGTALEAPLSELKVPEPPQAETPTSSLAEIERQQILHALDACDWVIGGPSGAAARLGMKRTSLQYRIQRLGIVRQQH